MATGKSRSAARGRKRRPSPKRFRLGAFLLRWTLLLTVVVGLAGLAYGVHLDRVVRGKFEGQRWALPARVFARPLELYVNRALSADDFEAELKRLNYRAAAKLSEPGTYRREGERFQVRTRPFRFWDGQEPGRHLAIQFAGRRY